MTPLAGPFVSRGGEKLAAALDHFGLNVDGLVCADLGSHIGGFVDCLLQRGARKVFAVDTSYGTLAWRLRRDPRVVVLERTNALHVTLPEAAELVTIDVGWTRQINVMPNVAKLMHDEGRVVSLIKPHYEASPDWLWGGVLPDDRVDEVVAAVLEELASIGWVAIDHVASALRGRAGNREFFALFAGPAGVTDRS